MVKTSGHNPGTINSQAEASRRIAYVLLWFPLSSETFIFREIQELEKLGLDIMVYTMYSKSAKGWSKQMRDYAGPIFRMGLPATFHVFGAFFRALKKNPSLVWQLLREGFFRRLRNLEALAENSWCFFAGFLLAEKCKADGISLIHSAWANGPATAAWVASRISNIPFAFTGRAGDIYPQDGILAEKARDSLFIRTNNAANVAWLASFCPKDQAGKVSLIYNGLNFSGKPRGIKKPSPPYQILAIGRFARTKGFPELLTAMARLRRENFSASLTLVGDGSWKMKLLRMRNELHLEDCVNMPGFVPNDQLAEFMESHDMLVVPSVVHSNGDRDGIPNVIMESLSIGLPVVATDVCGISEVIRNNETGLLVPPRDPAALAQAMRNMLENWPKAISMANAGRELVRHMFDPRINSGMLKSLYLEH